jgi:hypothetical protein
MNFSCGTKRIIAALEFAICLFCIANVVLGLQAFGPYGKEAMVGSAGVALLSIYLLGFNADTIRAAHEQKRGPSSDLKDEG